MNFKEKTKVIKFLSVDDILKLKFKNNIHYILDLLNLNEVEVIKIKENLCTFGKRVYLNKSSFVIIYKNSFNESLNIVPTLVEAYDFIEMEEIERNLF